ncbi:methyltransferase family protein [Actinomycetospora sp. C-140]
MYTTYVAHAAALVGLLVARSGRRPARSGTITVTGYGLAAVGAATSVAGMRRFTGTGHVSGMGDDRVVRGGVHVWSRHPQYLGYLALLSGLACARRSMPAAASATGAAGALAWWVPVEERHLAALFGSTYQRYLLRTPRWLGLPAPRSDRGPGPRLRAAVRRASSRRRRG